MLKNKFILLICSLGLFACQQIEALDEVVFDYNLFPKVLINAEQKNIKNLYEPKFYNSYIDHSLKNPPKHYLNNYFTSNINIFGTENKFEINIIDASLKKTEILNPNSKKYEEKTIFLFELSFLVEFVLYNDSNSVLASSIVEAKRTTTSGKFISLLESEKIIETLIYDCLSDFSFKFDELIRVHMKNFII